MRHWKQVYSAVLSFSMSLFRSGQLSLASSVHTFPVETDGLKARLRIRFLVPKSWKQAFRRSDFKVPFLWWECRKVICSVFTRSHFQDEQRIFNLAPSDHRDIMQNLSAPFIFQEECRMKIEHVLFPSVYSKSTDPCVGRSFSMSSHDPIFSEPTKIRNHIKKKNGHHISLEITVSLTANNALKCRDNELDLAMISRGFRS